MKLLNLIGSKSELIFSIENGMPELIHWGKHLSSAHGAMIASSKPVPQASLDEVAPLTLSADTGLGLFCSPGIQGHRNGLDWSPIFELENYTQSDTEILFHCIENKAQLRLTIRVGIDVTTDIVSWQASIQNLSETPYNLHRLFITIPVKGYMTELKSFGGRWCQEFKEHQNILKHGAIRIESRHGRTSHQKSPFWMIGRPGFSNCQGELIGLHLAWSGNHCFNFEVTSDGRHLVQVGELLLPGEKILPKFGEYQTPKLHLTWGDKGTNDISQSFHQFVRNNVLNWPQERPRPVILNTWEGIYFNHDPEYIIEMAKASAKIGVERFVLDDGWFRGRNGEAAALGDWQLDEEKYPDGLEPVIDAVKSLGMEFGIWVEPEMINPDSDLYRQHPDWAMHIPGYEAPLGRYQHVLNLQIPEAYDHILECLDALLSKYDIAYVKWDMNRQLVQAAHEGRPGSSGQTVAFYRLISALRQKHPNVEIESCASGGGRVDMGVLQYTHRFWTSDCNDALERVAIQSGFSSFFPPELMGAHIGADFAHTTHRRHNSQFRAMVAMFGHLGLELDPVKATEQETTELAHYVEMHKSIRHVLHDRNGRFIRIDTDADLSIKSWMALNQERSEAVIAFFQTAMPRFSIPPSIPLHYLDDNANYEIEALIKENDFGYAMKKEPKWLTQKVTVSGAWLNSHGLQLPILHPETGLLLKLTRV